MASTDLCLSDRPVDLDTLADIVATALDAGDNTTALDIVMALEELAGRFDDDRPPAAPVIARRFARAHQRILSGDGRTPLSRRPPRRMPAALANHGA